MNEKVWKFTRKVGWKFGDRVLEVGSLDVNGSIRANFPRSEYIGIDIREGPGVDLVLAAEELPLKFGAGYFDIVMCCETLEHVEHWREAMLGMWASLKDGGFMTITTPTQEKGRHDYPSDYWRWTLEDYRTIFRDQKIHRQQLVYERGIGVVVQKLTQTIYPQDVTPYAVP
jgi:predicted SAM-dependent methyltransferase